MSILPILCYPDPRLHTVAKPVAKVDDRIRQLVQDMYATMYDAQGVGLAATQVNVHERVVVVDVSEGRDEPFALINPELLWASEETQLGEEGCLSVPGIYDGVERSRSEEHTSELQSPCNLVCRLLLDKKKILALDIRAFLQGLRHLSRHTLNDPRRPALAPGPGPS